MYARRKILFAWCIMAALLAFPTHFVSASKADDIIELNSLSTIYGPVLFDHAMHRDITSCAECHHHTTGTSNRGEEEKCVACHKESCKTCKVACKDCHPASPETAEKLKSSNQTKIYHYDVTGLKRAYHVTCLGCHKEAEAVTGCEDCHVKREKVDSATGGQPQQRDLAQ